MELAVSVGISIIDFWELTPYEITVAVNAYCERRKREIEEYTDNFKELEKLIIYNSYLTSRWVWAKTVDIDSILNSDKQSKTMTNEQMLSVAMALNQMYGGEVING